MRNLTTILGLQPEGKIRKFFNRKHLFIIGFIFFVLLSITLSIILIIEKVNHKKENDNKSDNDNYCLNQGCLSAATYQLNLIDFTASSNLCTDFYTYACGSWQKTHPIQSFDIERTILGDIINQRDSELERLLNTPISRSSPRSWEYKLKVCLLSKKNDLRDFFCRLIILNVLMIMHVNLIVEGI